MYLIDKENGPLSVHPLDFLGFCHHFLHVFLAGYRGVDLGKFGTGGAGDNLCQSSLAGARRPIEDYGTDLIRLDGPIEQLIPADDMLLPHYLLQRPGTHSGRQGSLFFHVAASHIVKYIHVHAVFYRLHRFKYTSFSWTVTELRLLKKLEIRL